MWRCRAFTINNTSFHSLITKQKRESNSNEISVSAEKQSGRQIIYPASALVNLKLKMDLREAQILSWLQETYPDAHCALAHTNALELLIATILSAQCTDERVNLVTANLFRKYQNCQDYLNVTQQELEKDIHSTGFYRNKAKSIRGTCERILADFNGEVPRTMPELLTLPGVARKTANVVLGNVFGIASGVVVDTHVSRLSQRLALTVNTTPEKIEKDLMEVVPPDDWVIFSHWLIAHGRKICQARKPKCAECGLSELCPSSLLKL